MSNEDYEKVVRIVRIVCLFREEESEEFGWGPFGLWRWMRLFGLGLAGQAVALLIRFQRRSDPF